MAETENFPKRLRRSSPSATAEALIAEGRRIRREGILTDEDRQLADWARESRPSGRTCRCGRAIYDSHVVAARVAVNHLLHDENGGGKWKVYACRQGGGLHIGKDK